MKKITLILLFLMSLNAQSIEIENFKSGLMCGINKVDMGWVCFEQEEILISGQSSCQSMGDDFKCTWYGYSFNYKNAKVGQKINCTYTHSEPIASINLKSQNKAGALVDKYTFTLKKEEGYFVNPQYSTFGLSPDNNIHKKVQDVECSSEGKKLYEYRFITTFPPRIK